MPRTKPIAFQAGATPDQGELNNPGLIRANGMISVAGAYVPEGTFEFLSSNQEAWPAVSLSGTSVSLGDYLYQIYVGVGSELYEVNSLGGGVWDDALVSQHATAPYTVGESGWHFLQFGTHLIAVPGVSYDTTSAAASRIQYLGDTTSSTGTGDAANTDPDLMWPPGEFLADTTVWTAATAYVLGDAVNSVALNDTRVWKCTTAGTSHATTEPTWDTTVGNTTADNTVVWTTFRRKRFEDLIDYTDAGIYHLKARYVAPLGRRVLLGHVKQENATPTDGASAGAGYYPNRVHWSVTDDPTSFTDESINEAHLSGFADLLDDWGPITGLSGGSDYALIFKSRGIYRMSWGGSYTYSFQPIPNGFGCRWSHSIVRVGHDVYFWGPSGPCVYRGGEGRVEEIGLGRVSRSLVDSSWITSGSEDLDSLDSSIADRKLSGAHDSSNGVVAWLYQGNTNVTAIFYDYRADIFTHSKIDVWNGYSGTTHLRYLFNNPDTGDIFSAPRDLMALADNIVNGSRVYGWVKSTGNSNATNLSIKTGFFEIQPDKRVMVTRVRPVFSLNSGETVPPTITVTVNSRDKTYGAVTTVTGTNTSNLDKMGWITLPSSSYRSFNQIQIDIDPTNRDRVAEFEAYQIEYKMGGDR